MKNIDFKEVLHKVDELRALFIFGQRVLPFLEEVLNFVREMAPLLEEMNESIIESTHKIPGVASQLENVTQATQNAATEILDLVDAVLLELEEIKGARNHAESAFNRAVRIDGQIMRHVRKELAGKEEVLAKIEELHKRKKKELRQVRKWGRGTETHLESVQEKVEQIMLALQVQDITAQQIAAANQLIDSISKRLSHILNVFEGNKSGAAPDNEPEGPITYNPHAVYDKSGQRQQVVEEILQSFSPDKEAGSGDGAEHSVSSSPELDTLSKQVPVTPPPAISASPVGSDDTPTSQNEIDQLFRNTFGE